MKIGELSRLTGLRPSRIRYYEKQGLLPQADRRDNGYRDYGSDSIQRLQLIMISQELGFSLSEIRRALPADGEEFPPCADMIGGLKSKLADLDAHISELNIRRGKIIGMIETIERHQAEGVHDLDGVRKSHIPVTTG